MLDTMTATKIVGALCGALLVLLLGKWAADIIYHIGTAVHGKDHAKSTIFADLEVDDHAAGASEQEEVDLAALLAIANPDKGQKVFAKCKACHKLEEAVNGVGPHLVSVIGRPVAEVAGFDYSGPMAALQGEWTEDRISDFLANPRKFLPGTKMSFAGLKKGADRANLIAYFRSLAQ